MTGMIPKLHENGNTMAITSAGTPQELGISKT